MVDRTNKQAEVTLFGPGNSQITSTTDAGKERLDVSATLAGVSNITPIEVKYDKEFSAVNADEWQELAEYTVPSGYKFDVNSFRCHSAVAGETARVIVETMGATYNTATNTFTDGDAISAPQFASGLYLYVTTQIGSGSDDVFTITYVNQDGTGGRTCVITVTKSSLVGTHIEGVLQTGDIGVRDITNITHTATGQAGEVIIEMYYAIFSILMTDSGTQYQAVSIAGNATVIPEGQILVLQILAGTKTSYVRHIALTGGLS